MGLAEELKQSNAKPNAAIAAAAAEASDAVMNNGLEALNTTAPTEAPAAQPEPAVEPAKASNTKIRIGAKEFDNAEAALNYANELELLQIQDASYKAGLNASNPKAAETPPEDDSLPPDIENQLFDDPKKALKAYGDKLRQQITADIKKEAEVSAAKESAWNKFYTENPKLGQHKDIVEYVMQKNWKEVGFIPLTEGLSKVAEKTYELLKIKKESDAPTTELSSRSVNVPGVGGSPTTPVIKNVEQPIDFIAQINKHRNKRSN